MNRADVTRQVVLSSLILLVLGLSRAMDPVGLIFSSIGLTYFLTWLPLVGLAVLAQQLTCRAGIVDFSGAAQLAVASGLVIGLSAPFGTAGAIAGAVAVAAVIAVSCAAGVQMLRAPAALVTLIPVVLAPAALPEHAARLAPTPVSVFANGTWDVWFPPLAGGYLVALILVALLLGPGAKLWRGRVADDARPVLAFLAASLLWALLGVWWSGRHGAAMAPPLWLPALGLGGALLVGRRRGLDLVGGIGVAVLAALLLNLGDSLLPTVGDPALSRIQALLATLALLAGLLVRRASTDPDGVDPDGVGRPPARVDEHDVDATRLAGGEPERGDVPADD